MANGGREAKMPWLWASPDQSFSSSRGLAGNIEISPSKHMYVYLSLVERKVADFYHNMIKMTYFHRFLLTIDSVLI